MTSRPRNPTVAKRRGMRSAKAWPPVDDSDDEFIAEIVASLPGDGARIVAELERVKSVYVECDRDDVVREAFQEFLQMILAKRGARRDEGGCFFVTGESGAGKTLVVEHLLARQPKFQPRQTSYGPVCPVLSVSLAGPCTLKTVGKMVMEEAGYPIERDYEENELWAMIPHQLHLRKVLLVNIDETQHLLRRTKKDNKRKDLANAIKGAMNHKPWPISFILSGLPETTELIRLDEQIERRHGQVFLSDIDLPDERDLVENILSRMAETVGVKIDRLLGSDVPERLAHSVAYRYGRVAQATLAALQKAVADRKRELTRKHFASAFIDHSHARGVDTMNPFLVADWRRLKPGSFIIKKDPRT